ncbi:MAG: secondary thiamine-phosphate synthase enzyme YjbQ [Proteobacteria bacterium]|nr:secondary thiamine-phosphate synthase enzyme YjbQ [Pseudomonadota bacterium]MDA1132536.1 secondary thiamine-phosphate synthase enzyme YjbQ [Pseudomonadota bacterium]
MQQVRTQIEVQGRGRGFTDLTATISDWIGASSIRFGMFTAFVPHTSASLLIQENADPDVRADLEAFFSRLVPDGDPAYRHRSEGPDDMPSHIRSALTQSQISVPVENSALALGAWQSIYLWEHRTSSRHRQLYLHLVGE